MRLGEPQIASASDPEAADGLRDCALNPHARVELLLELIGLLFDPRERLTLAVERM